MIETIIELMDDIVDSLKGKLGIDVGASLTKIAYIKDKKLAFMSIPTNYEKVINFLNENQGFKVNLTGGKAFKIYTKFCKDNQFQLIDEFKAQVQGIELLFNLNQKKMPLETLFVSVGTGTSILLIKQTEFERVGGSALGGGAFMGLIKLLYNIDEFDEAMNLAKQGNPYNVDLKVADIYDKEDQRINPLFRQFTASSLGKIALFENTEYKKEDLINSIISLISENISSQLILYAQNRNVRNIIFTGGFLKNNSIFKQMASIMCRMNKIKTYFLKYNEMVSALGALRF